MPRLAANRGEIGTVRPNIASRYLCFVLLLANATVQLVIIMISFIFFAPCHNMLDRFYKRDIVLSQYTSLQEAKCFLI